MGLFERRAALQRLWRMTLLQGAGATGALCCMSGCEPVRSSQNPLSMRPGLPHGFYVWQQVWRPGLTSALHAAQPLVGDWRVLAFHVNGAQRRRASVDVAALQDCRKPVRMVVRVEGSQLGLLDDALIEQIKAVRAQWAAQGLPFAGLELDHDVAESQLPGYAAWLSRLRQAMPGASLSITALPAWLNSPALPCLLAVPDEVVLQVHAVRQPSAGLFDARSAQTWISTLAQRHDGPFRVALPCYGSRVVFDEWGQTLAVESEADVTVRSNHERELLASPKEAASLLSWLDVHAPSRLQGIMWFRLPTLSDQRSWRLSTWQALVSGTRSWAPLQASLAPTEDARLWEVNLHNASALDQDLPLHIDLPGDARTFDGERGYGADVLSPAPRLSRMTAGWLRPGEQLRVGWVRCEHASSSTLLEIHAG